MCKQIIVMCSRKLYLEAAKTPFKEELGSRIQHTAVQKVPMQRNQAS